MERPEPLVSRDLRLEVPERLAADGSVLLPLDAAALRAPGAAMLQQQRDRGGGDQLPALLHQSGA